MSNQDDGEGDTREYKIIDCTDGPNRLMADVTSDFYDDFNQWMNFIDFAGEWNESSPMETSFTFPQHLLFLVQQAMNLHGYVQVNN